MVGEYRKITSVISARLRPYGAQGGRAPFDPVMMFAILMMQAFDKEAVKHGADKVAGEIKKDL